MQFIVLWLMLLGLGVSAAEPIFEVVQSKTSGLDFRFESGSRGKFDLPEIMGGGMAAADFDGDGRLDLFFCQGGMIEAEAGKTDPPCRWYRNQGQMQFKEMKVGSEGPSYAMGAWPADFDEDGKVDLFVTGWRGWKLYRNQGEWQFEDVTSSLGSEALKWSTAAVWADFNGDRHLDLYVGGYVEYDPSRAPFCAAPDGARDYCGPEDFVVVMARASSETLQKLLELTIIMAVLWAQLQLILIRMDGWIYLLRTTERRTTYLFKIKSRDLWTRRLSQAWPLQVLARRWRVWAWLRWKVLINRELI